MGRGALLVTVTTATALGLWSTPSLTPWLSPSSDAWGATSWQVVLASGSKGEARSQTLPSAPAGVTATCTNPVTSKTVTVTWSAVTRATGYVIWQSTTSATGTYSRVATVGAVTTWTSGTLTAGTHYWYEAVADIGSAWASPNSAATAERTINAITPFCS
jgi:hypothetical protein